MNKYDPRQTPLPAGGAVEAATYTVDTDADPHTSGRCGLHSAKASLKSKAIKTQDRHDPHLQGKRIQDGHYLNSVWAIKPARSILCSLFPRF